MKKTFIETKRTMLPDLGKRYSTYAKIYPLELAKMPKYITRPNGTKVPVRSVWAKMPVRLHNFKEKIEGKYYVEGEFMSDWVQYK